MRATKPYVDHRAADTSNDGAVDGPHHASQLLKAADDTRMKSLGRRKKAPKAT
jgi:hypothetical protein